MVAASLLGAAKAIFKGGQVYGDLGAGHFTRNDRMCPVAELTQRLRKLGYEVDLDTAT